MANKVYSREHRICCAIWRKAWLERDTAPPVEINAANYNAGISLRQAMYRAAAPFRKGTMFDEAIRQAAENFIVSLEERESKSEPCKLRLLPRQSLKDLEAQLSILGISEVDLIFADETGVERKLDSFLEETRVSPPKRSTDFYER